MNNSKPDMSAVPSNVSKLIEESPKRKRTHDRDSKTTGACKTRAKTAKVVTAPTILNNKHGRTNMDNIPLIPHSRNYNISSIFSGKCNTAAAIANHSNAMKLPDNKPDRKVTILNETLASKTTTIGQNNKYYSKSEEDIINLCYQPAANTLTETFTYEPVGSNVEMPVQILPTVAGFSDKDYYEVAVNTGREVPFNLFYDTDEYYEQMAKSPFKVQPVKHNSAIANYKNMIGVDQRENKRASFTQEKNLHSSFSSLNESIQEESNVEVDLKLKHFEISPTYRRYQLLGDSQLLRFSHQILKMSKWPATGNVRRIGYCVSGQTSGDLLVRLQHKECKLHSEVILLIGTNDFIRGYDLIPMIDNYNAILSILIESCNRIILLTVPPLPKYDGTYIWKKLQQLNSFILSKANNKQIFVIDLCSIFISFDNTVSKDYFEPTIGGGSRSDLIHLNIHGFKMLRALLDTKYFDIFDR